MRKMIVVLAMLLLTGCKVRTDIKLDTIIDIPQNPVIVATEPATDSTEPESTEAPTEKKKTESTKKEDTANKKTDTTKKPSTEKKETEPVTEAPTQPPTEPPTQYDPKAYVSNALDWAVADLVNEQRIQADLEPLTFDEDLAVLAAVRALEVTQKWSHTRPNGTDGLTVLETYGSSWECAGETFYYGPAQPEHVLEKWLMANGEQGIIFLESAAVVGIANITTPDGLTYVAALMTG